MEIKVKSKFLHLSPRKLRLVVNLVRGKNAISARTTLQFVPNKGASMVAGLITSALAVAKNSEIDPELFVISSIACGDGPRLKRGKPASKGRMMRIVKRQSHLTLSISDTAKAAEIKAPEVKKTEKVEKIANKKEPNGTKS